MAQKKKTRADTGGVKISGGKTVVRGSIIGRDQVVHEARTPVVPALHQLPPPPRDFTGREKEIRELMEAVGSGGVTISGLQGMGGVGKTALALKLAEQLAPRYPDAQFYLDLMGVRKDPLAPVRVMEHVIHAYHPDAKLPEDEAELSGLYRSVLHGQRALLLWDNAADAEHVKPLIPRQGYLERRSCAQDSRGDLTPGDRESSKATGRVAEKTVGRYLASLGMTARAGLQNP